MAKTDWKILRLRYVFFWLLPKSIRVSRSSMKHHWSLPLKIPFGIPEFWADEQPKRLVILGWSHHAKIILVKVISPCLLVSTWIKTMFFPFFVGQNSCCFSKDPRKTSANHWDNRWRLRMPRRPYDSIIIPKWRPWSTFAPQVPRKDFWPRSNMIFGGDLGWEMVGKRTCLHKHSEWGKKGHLRIEISGVLWKIVNRITI